MRKFLDSAGNWRPVGTVMPLSPDVSDPRGVTTPFHGRFRGAHNTGVPNPANLATPQFGRRFSSPNQTISDQHFIGYVEINATGITFERCRFEASGDNIYTLYANQLVTLVDCDIYGGKARDNAVVVSGAVHAIRCHIWGGGNDNISYADGGIYEDCYVHGSNPHYGTHTDVVQVYGGTSNVKMLRSKLMAFDPYTGVKFNAAMQMGSLATPVNDIEITDNYLDGGGYSINAFMNTSTTSGIVIQGNRWGRNFAFGPITGTAIPGPTHGIFTSDNAYDDTGVQVWQ